MNGVQGRVIIGDQEVLVRAWDATIETPIDDAPFFEWEPQPMTFQATFNPMSQVPGDMTFKGTIERVAMWKTRNWRVVAVHSRLEDGRLLVLRQPYNIRVSRRRTNRRERKRRSR